MIVRIVLLVILLWVIWQTLRKAVGPSRSRRPSRPPGGSARLVRCASCGVHIPQTRSLTVPGGHVFCSEACLKLGKTAAVG